MSEKLLGLIDKHYQDFVNAARAYENTNDIGTKRDLYSQVLDAENALRLGMRIVLDRVMVDLGEEIVPEGQGTKIVDIVTKDQEPGQKSTGPVIGDGGGNLGRAEYETI